MLWQNNEMKGFLNFKFQIITILVPTLLCYVGDLVEPTVFPSKAMAPTRSLRIFLAGDFIKYQMHIKGFKNKITHRIQNDKIQIHSFFRDFLYQTAKSIA